MMHVLAAYFHGTLHGAVETWNASWDSNHWLQFGKRCGTGSWRPWGGAMNIHHGRMPILYAGRNASGGYSRMLRAAAGFTK